jgi:hypothetical protein
MSDKRDGHPACGATRTRHVATPAMRRDGPRPAVNGAVPLTGQRSKETQAFGTIVQLPIALAGSVIPRTKAS